MFAFAILIQFDILVLNISSLPGHFIALMQAGLNEGISYKLFLQSLGNVGICFCICNFIT